MAYEVSYCLDKTGKTFEHALTFNDQYALLVFLISVFGLSSEEPTSMMIDVNHSKTKSAVRKVRDLNKFWNNNLIHKIKIKEISDAN